MDIPNILEGKGRMIKEVTKDTDWVDSIGTTDKGITLTDAMQNRLYDLVEKSIAYDVFEYEPIRLGNARKDANTDNYYIMSKIPGNAADSVAMVLDMDAQPTGSYVQGQERYVIPIFKISTVRYSKQVIDIKKDNIMPDNIINKVLEALLFGIDSYLVRLSRAAVDATSQEVRGDQIDKATITEGMKMVVNDGSVPVKIVMRKDDFFVLLRNRKTSGIEMEMEVMQPTTKKAPSGFSNDTWESILIENILAGNTICRLEGLRVILTRRDSLLDPGEMFIFSPPQLTGKMCSNSVSFEMEKRFTMLQWQAYLSLGMNFGNVYSVSRVLLQAANAKATDDADISKGRWFRRIINSIFRK